jgi:long-chain fatty acid transport protein
VRLISFSGDVGLFTGSGGAGASYVLAAEASTEIGYMIGGAYERPDIAMRVALTYYSETTHDVTASETTGLGTAPTTFETSIPQQILLEGQTGVAPGTLVFGSLRWTDWTAFSIAPRSIPRASAADVRSWTTKRTSTPGPSAARVC